MTVDFFINKSDNRYVNKTLESVITLNNVYLKSDENKETMTLELDYNTTVLTANYCFIRELSHYYYISEPTFGKQRIFLPIKTDLLMTFKNDILNLDCIIARQENEYNAYLNDDRFPVLNKQKVNTLAFPHGFSNTDNIIMVVNGG